MTYGQTTNSFYGNPGIDFKFKRCVCSGSTAYVDFTITNNSKVHVQGHLLEKEPCSGFANYYTAAYDDEGNMYTFRTAPCKINHIDIANQSVSYNYEFSFDLPVGVPVRMRVTLSNVDEYATTISLLKVCFRNMNPSEYYGQALFEAKNIPIVRQ